MIDAAETQLVAGRQQPATHVARDDGFEHVLGVGCSHLGVRYFESAFFVTESELHVPTTIAHSASLEHARSVCETPAQSMSRLRQASLSPLHGSGAAIDSPGPMPHAAGVGALDGAGAVGFGADGSGGGAASVADVADVDDVDDVGGG